MVREAKADILFAPGYTGPLLCPVPMVVAIHDMSFAAHPEWFDRREGLRSIPVRFGVPRSLRISRGLHVITVASLAALGVLSGLGVAYAAGVAIVAVLLVYEQSLVTADDLSQVKRAFDLNGWVGVLYFAATALDVYLGKGIGG
jgi:4-hydroxybenzoate polyprenyltransferase